jgi:uncharacterized protein
MEYSGKMSQEHFWEEKSLSELSGQEWESLCDGCAICCLYKLQDEDTEDVMYTRVACRLLDASTCRCSQYPDRHILNPECILLEPEIVKTLSWLPKTCAYRLLAEGKALKWWHPLVCGNDQTVHISGNSILGKYISEVDVDMDMLEDYISDWE